MPAVVRERDVDRRRVADGFAAGMRCVIWQKSPDPADGSEWNWFRIRIWSPSRWNGVDGDEIGRW